MKNINREDKNAKGFHTWQSDKARTGLCDVKGSITNPSISFEMDISSKRHIFEYAGAIGQNSAIPKNIEADGKFVADITAPGEGKTDTTHQRTGYFLPGAKELQKVECDTYFGNLNIDDLRVRFYIFDSQKNDWELKWESEHIHMLCLSLPIIADIDDDGKIELAVFPWYDVVVFDLETGTQKYRSSFHNEKVKHGRAYGWVGAYDALHDGRKEIFIIPNHNHMAMMGWEGDELKLKWSHFFEEDCAVMKTAYNIPEHAVMDIDGDGELEILTSIYNWHDDNRWHIYVLNAATGDIILDIPDRYLYDNIDAEKTGNWLTASMKTSGRRINKYGDLNFMKFYRENGKLIFKDIWEQKKSEFSSRAKVVRDDHMNNMMFTATDPIRFAKIGEDKYAFATTFYRDVSKIDTTLTLWSIESGEIKKISKIEGKRLKMLGNINTPPHISSDAAFNENEAESSGLICDSCKLEYIGSSHIRPILGGASVGQFCPGKPLAIFAEDALDNMVAFTLSEKKGETELCLATPGRAMFYGSTTLSGYYLMGAGYELCDIDGDGYVEVLSAWGAESGNAELRATKYDGSVIFRHELDDVPSERPHWNTGGLCLWSLGHFLEKDKTDIFVTMRFGNAPSGRLINLRTDKEEWRRTYNDIGNIFGGTMMSVTDFDGDGLDDLVFTYTQSVYAVDGATGETIMNQRNPADAPALGNMNISLDVDGDGKTEIVYVGDPHLMGLTNHDGNFVWTKTLVKDENNAATGGIMPAIFDCDGDGELEMIMPFVPVKKDLYIKCYNIKTGGEKWSLKMDEPFDKSKSAGGALTADIDGDGKLEMIFTSGALLMCYGFDGDNIFGKKWEYRLPDLCGYPVIADFGKNGGVQIIVSCADGKIYGVK